MLWQSRFFKAGHGVTRCTKWHPAARNIRHHITCILGSIALTALVSVLSAFSFHGWHVPIENWKWGPVTAPSRHSPAPKENLKFEEKTTVDKGKLLGWQQHNLRLINVVNLELEWQETIHEVPRTGFSLGRPKIDSHPAHWWSALQCCWLRTFSLSRERDELI